jgi:hypothetical protein
LPFVASEPYDMCLRLRNSLIGVVIFCSGVSLTWHRGRHLCYFDWRGMKRKRLTKSLSDTQSHSTT